MFPVLPGPLHPVTSPKTKGEEKLTKSNLCCPYTHWSMASGQSLKENYFKQTIKIKNWKWVMYLPHT